MAERTIYLNGDFVPESEAKVSVMDWGFSGGDAVYEVTRSFNHALFRFEDHLSRLYRTLASSPQSSAAAWAGSTQPEEMIAIISGGCSGSCR